MVESLSFNKSMRIDMKAGIEVDFLISEGIYVRGRAKNPL